MPDRETQLFEHIQRVDYQAPSEGLGKHRKMAISPFVFFRGAAQLFYADLSNGELSLPDALAKVPLTTVMGDCHTSNFGFFTEEGSHGDSVVFAVNDFDDACLGLAGWDLLRYCVSLFLCADHCQHVSKGNYATDAECVGKPAVDASLAQQAAAAFLSAYQATCEDKAQGRISNLDTLDTFSPGSALHKAHAKAVGRAAGGDRFWDKSALAKAVDFSISPPRFKSLPQRFKAVASSNAKLLREAFAPYMDDSILDVVERLNAGTGSVNMRRYYFLVGPRDYQDKSDLPLCHIVEVKQQRQAAPLYFFPDLHPANRLNPAHLTAMCQRRMQCRPDLLLDEVIWSDSHWLVRSRHHAKVGFDPEDIGLGKRAVNKGGFIAYAAYCGQALALAHSRGDRRSSRFEWAVVAALQSTHVQLVERAQTYANQVISDWQWFCRQQN